MTFFFTKHLFSESLIRTIQIKTAEALAALRGLKDKNRNNPTHNAIFLLQILTLLSAFLTQL